ncbi:hypothetical protein KR222_004612, partial [Zaprionus bogoriensis]
RGKHRTAQQDAIFVAFMERHPIIAKNYYKGDKLAREAAWKRLSKELNSVGPPVKEADEWKRVSSLTIRQKVSILSAVSTTKLQVWKDWKSCIRKKIANNRLEPNGSGKSSLYQDTLTPLEDAVAIITDLYEMADVMVESQPKAKARGNETGTNMQLSDIKTDQDEEHSENEEYEESDESISVRNVGVKVEQQLHQHSTSKKRRLDSDHHNGSTGASDSTVLMDIAKELRDLNRQTRLNAQRTEANTEALLAMGTQISDLMQQQLKERKRLNAIMEKFVLKMETAD